MEILFTDTTDTECITIYSSYCSGADWCQYFFFMTKSSNSLLDTIKMFPFNLILYIELLKELILRPKAVPIKLHGQNKPVTT
jgi:hypothetical protein